MSGMREFQFEDLFKFNRICLDPLTEVFPLSFILPKVLEFPQLAQVATAPNDQPIGFILVTRTVQQEGIGAGKDPNVMDTHGHVGILSIDHDFRRLGLATMLMNHLNHKLELQRDWYVDLFVRSTNQKAISFYQCLGYVKYRWLPQFYGDDNAYEMRLPLSQDVNRISVKHRQFMVEGLRSTVLQLMEQLKMFLFRFRDSIVEVL